MLLYRYTLNNRNGKNNLLVQSVHKLFDNAQVIKFFKTVTPRIRRGAFLHQEYGSLIVVFIAKFFSFLSIQKPERRLKNFKEFLFHFQGVPKIVVRDKNRVVIDKIGVVKVH